MEQDFLIPYTTIRIGRFLLLLASIVLLFLVRPFLTGFMGVRLVMDIFLTFMLLSGVYAVSKKRTTLAISLVIAVPALVGKWSNHLLEIKPLAVIANALILLFFMYIVVLILAYLFRERKITADIIIGGICVYFLLGVIWGIVFTIQAVFDPGALRIPGNSQLESPDFLYYSFVTLTTLGYGDMTPVSASARAFATLEAMTGQVYLAVLIARLVGMHISQSMDTH